jgi:hypothetical protein
MRADVDAEEREYLSYLDGLWKAYSEGRGKLPPPWVTTPKKPKLAKNALSTVLALYPARPYPTADEEPWLVRALLYDVEEGPPVLTQVNVEHRQNPTTVEVTGNALRRLPIATIRDRANAQLRQRPDYLDALDIFGRVTPAERQRARRAAVAAKKLPLTRGRKGYPEAHYRRIALRAVEIFDPDRKDGGRRDVLNALAEEEKKPYSTVRDWISRARGLGYLVPAKQGRTDFRPGPNLYRNEASDD